MSILGKQRVGPNRTQIIIYVDKDMLAEFDSYVPDRFRSRVIREMINAYNMKMRERKEK